MLFNYTTTDFRNTNILDATTNQSLYIIDTPMSSDITSVKRPDGETVATYEWHHLTPSVVKFQDKSTDLSKFCYHKIPGLSRYGSTALQSPTDADSVSVCSNRYVDTPHGAWKWKQNSDNPIVR